MTNTEYVDLLYRKILGRSPDAGGLAHYTQVLDATNDLKLVIDALVSSEEYARRDTAPTKPLRIVTKNLLDRPITIVDVGAQKLAHEDHIYAPLQKSKLEWRCIGFEPQETRRQERLLAETDARLTMLNAFVGDGLKHRFRVVNDDGSSSLLPLNKPFIADFDHIETLETVGEQDVMTGRLDDLLREEVIVDFLKFDIQGFEFEALKSAGDVLGRTNVVHSECFFGPMYLGQGYFSDIDRLLRNAGFEFIDFSYLARYRYVAVPKPSTSGERLIWADAVWFRRLDPDRDLASNFAAQAAIADLVYNKPGLAQEILLRKNPEG